MKIKANKILAVLCVIAMVMTMIVPMTMTAAAEDVTETITFDANKTQRTSFSTSMQEWASGGVTFTNNKSTSTSNVADYSNPVRLYASSSITLNAPGIITKIEFTCSSTSYANALKSAIGSTATVNGSKVTVTHNATEFTVKLTAQVRLNSLAVTYAAGGNDSCNHPETVAIGVAKEATCTETGMTAGLKCADPECDATIEAQAVIPALGHNFVDGVCTRCGEIGPVYSYTFVSGVFDDESTVALGDVNWTLNMVDSTHLGWDSNLGRGVQFGKSADPATSITLTSDSFSNVSKIVINTSGASGTDAKLTVTVGGTQIGEVISTTTSAAEYEFTSKNPLSGSIELDYTLTTAAVYIKSIEVYCTVPAAEDVINTVDASMQLAYKYVEENGTIVDSLFVLNCGVDAALAEIDDVDAFGIKVAAGENEVYYTFGDENVKSWKNEGGMLSVSIDLGNMFDNVERFETKFTVRAFVEVDGVKYESELEKTYSVASMVEEYYEVKNITEVEHLYNILFPAAN